jgi:hypothetical protein
LGRNTLGHWALATVKRLRLDANSRRYISNPGKHQFSILCSELGAQVIAPEHGFGREATFAIPLRIAFDDGASVERTGAELQTHVSRALNEFDRCFGQGCQHSTFSVIDS